MSDQNLLANKHHHYIRRFFSTKLKPLQNQVSLRTPNRQKLSHQRNLQTTPPNSASASMIILSTVRITVGVSLCPRA